MMVLNKFDVFPEIDDHYIIEKFTKPPVKIAFKHALKYKISSYSRIWDLEFLKISLAKNNTTVCGIKVYQSLESDKVAKTGIVSMPKNLMKNF
jgi:hypothetical protein